MTRYTKTPVTQLSANESAALQQINKNLDDIQAAIQDTVSRSGQSPTQMTADLDMNGKRLINVPAPLTDNDLVRRVDVVNDISMVQSLVNTASTAAGQAIAAAEGVQEAIADAHVGIVADDLVLGDNSKIRIAANNIDDISTCSNDIEDIKAVGDNISNVMAVADNETNINAVNSNKTNINAVAGNKANIDTVAGVSTDVSTVADIATDVTTVASNTANINTVASDISNVNAVAADLTNIDAVAANSTNINAVNSNKTNIDAVAGNKTNIDTVAGISSNVTTVAGMSSNISSVVSDLTNINSVASDLTNIDAVAGELPSIITKANTNASNFTATGKSYLSSLGMPSDTYEDLTLGASGDTYTAPANGYYAFSKYSTAVNQYYGVVNTNNNIRCEGRSVNSSVLCGVFVPVKKNDVVQVGYGLGGATEVFRFIYAEGEV